MYIAFCSLHKINTFPLWSQTVSLPYLSAKFLPVPHLCHQMTSPLFCPMTIMDKFLQFLLHVHVSRHQRVNPPSRHMMIILPTLHRCCQVRPPSHHMRIMLPTLLSRHQDCPTSCHMKIMLPIFLSRHVIIMLSTLLSHHQVCPPSCHMTILLLAPHSHHQAVRPPISCSATRHQAASSHRVITLFFSYMMTVANSLLAPYSHH